MNKVEQLRTQLAEAEEKQRRNRLRAAMRLLRDVGPEMVGTLCHIFKNEEAFTGDFSLGEHGLCTFVDGKCKWCGLTEADEEL